MIRTRIVAPVRHILPHAPDPRSGLSLVVPTWLREGDLLIWSDGQGLIVTKRVTRRMAQRFKEEIMAKRASRKARGPTSPRATYTIEWWISPKDGCYYARAVCDQNGEETWRQSEGLRRKIDMTRVIARLWCGLWRVRKAAAAPI